MTPQEEKLFIWLGEIKSDVRYLVESRRQAHERMDNLEAELTSKINHQNTRLTTLEAFKIRIGVVVSFLGIAVPMISTVLLKKFGLL